MRLVALSWLGQKRPTPVPRFRAFDDPPHGSLANKRKCCLPYRFVGFARLWEPERLTMEGSVHFSTEGVRYDSDYPRQ